MASLYRRLVVLLVRPSRYDDDGYVVRHWRGTLPSNSLACLTSLTEDVIDSGVLGIEVRVEGFDDTVSRINAKALARRYQRAGTKVVAGLVGVQTNQFPRAQDLAREFRSVGFDVIVGGFHVSGTVALSAAMPPECQQLLDAGVTLVAGEIEGRWSDILADAVADRLQPVYNYLRTPPDLTDMPLPRAPRRARKGSLPSHIGTIDASRGCPFACSFCSIINVQGRRMRARSARCILDEIRRNYVMKGGRSVRHYFFTDDNFSRNPQWEAIFDGLIRLREEEKVSIDFMMQVDTQASAIPGFVDKAARAGCGQVFIGIESLRDDNLVAGGKPQNRAGDFREMIARWHEVGIVCHAGYIIGFPHDTYERVMEDVRALAETLLVDQASFFMLTPIPGSRDHQAAVAGGQALDPDYNNYDSFHVTRAHPRMSRDEWERAFRDAWREFYSFEHMRRFLLAQNPATYWSVFKNLIWCRAAMAEEAHPMVTGFFRRKERASRRPAFPLERRWPFLKRRVREIAHTLSAYLQISLEMQELWLATRIRRDDYWFLGDLRRLGPRSVRAAQVRWARLHASIGPALATAQQRLGSKTTVITTTLHERVDLFTQTVGARAHAAGDALARLHPVHSRVGAGLGTAVDEVPEPAAVPPSALADYRLPELPPVPAPTALRRRLARLNPFALGALEPDAALLAYWQRTYGRIVRLQLWRLNPVTLAWNLVRGTRRTLLFLAAMQREWY